MGFKQHISRTWQMIEQQVNDVPFRPHDETAADREVRTPCSMLVCGFWKKQKRISYIQFTSNNTEI